MNEVSLLRSRISGRVLFSKLATSLLLAITSSYYLVADDAKLQQLIKGKHSVNTPQKDLLKLAEGPQKTLLKLHCDKSEKLTVGCGNFVENQFSRYMIKFLLIWHPRKVRESVLNKY